MLRLTTAAARWPHPVSRRSFSAQGPHGGGAGRGRQAVRGRDGATGAAGFSWDQGQRACRGDGRTGATGGQGQRALAWGDGRPAWIGVTGGWT